MLSSIGSAAKTWVRGNPWTNVYGVARSLIALQAALMLAANRASTLFPPAVGVPNPPTCTSITNLSLFCLVPADALDVARWIAVFVLLVVASGWRPRITGILHWWLAFSLMSTGVVITGGEAIAALLTFLLLPMTLTDPRRWHWTSLSSSEWKQTSPYRRLVAWGAYVLVRIQIAAVYFHSAVGKVTVDEWVNGTAVYYWLADPSFGLAGWIEPFVMPVLTTSVGVVLATWGPLLLEFFLFAGLVTDKRGWPFLLGLGIALHLGIAVLHGLVGFSTVMVGALILYLRPLDEPFVWPSSLKRALGGIRDLLPAQRAMGQSREVV